MTRPATGADVHPADDVLGRWTLVLQLARNDLELAAFDIDAAAKADRDDGTLLHRSRIAAGHLYEAALMLRRANEVPEVRAFVKTLPAEVSDEYRSLLDAAFLKKVLKPDRNLTFHYPGIVEGESGYDALRAALEKLGREPVDLIVEGGEGGKLRRYRYAFPDLVAAEFAVGAFGTTEREWEEAAERVRNALITFVRAVDRIIERYWER